jgi:hypothetical protein
MENILPIPHRHVWDKRETIGWEMLPLWKCIICGIEEIHKEELEKMYDSIAEKIYY